MPDPNRKAAVGFAGGQVLSVEAADGAVLVDVGQVVYLRVESDEHRVGF